MYNTQNNPGLAAIFGNNPYSVGALVAAHAQNQPVPSVADINGAGPYSKPSGNFNPANDGATYTPAAATGPAYDPNELAQFDQSISTINNGLNRLPTQLEIAKGNIGTKFNTSLNELDSGKNHAQNSYTTSGNENQQNFRTDKNAIADKSAMGLRGLLRMLGSMGAGGSTEATRVAPEAVATEASQERAGAGQTFAQNQSSLDTNWNNFLADDENSRRKLTDWRTEQDSSAESQSQQAKQDLLLKLADISGKREALKGGSYTGAAQPYLDQANTLSAVIDSLAKINPSYTGVTPVYNAPTLDSYSVNQGGPQAPTAPSNALEQQLSPFLSLILGQKDKKLAGV